MKEVPALLIALIPCRTACDERHRYFLKNKKKSGGERYGMCLICKGNLSTLQPLFNCYRIQMLVRIIVILKKLMIHYK